MQGEKLSFKINTNFALALQKLREHHGNDCWVHEDLEKVWYEMYQLQE